MIGFEVNINGKCILAATEEGITTLVLLKKIENKNTTIELEINGIERAAPEESVFKTWLHQQIKDGDEIFIKVVDTDNTSPSSDINLTDIEETTEYKLQQYLLLKKKLESLNAI